MPEEQGGTPQELPPHWSTAHDLWRIVEGGLPPETPPDLRVQLEQDCYALFERVFDLRGQETQVSMSGKWGPELVAKMVQRTVEVGTRQVANAFLVELLRLRVEVAVLKMKVRKLEDEQR